MIEVVLTLIVSLVAWAILLAILYTTIFGGELTYKSEGLIPLVKRLNRERKASNVKSEEG